MRTYGFYWTLICRCYLNIPEPHFAVIALEHKGAGRAFVTVQRSARDTGHLFFIHDRLAVERDRQLATDQGDLVLLPLAGGL